MLSRLFYPHIGGVEKHVYEICKRLKAKGEKVTVITKKYNKALRNEETIDGIKVIRFSYPEIKYLGLFYIWFWFIKNRKIFKKVDVVHCHDVFIWYLPLRIAYPKKPVYTTIHGWEGKYPISTINIYLKRLSAKLSWGVICVGKYIKKYYGIKTDFVTYGGVRGLNIRVKLKKEKNRIVYLGRLKMDTGLLQFLKILKTNKTSEKYKVDFCGDGPMRKECEKYGKVHGLTNPHLFLKESEICFASGYLSAFEALIFKCRLWVGWDNSLKQDYWMMSPFSKWIDSEKCQEASSWAEYYSWNRVLDTYLKLWRK